VSVEVSTFYHYSVGLLDLKAVVYQVPLVIEESVNSSNIMAVMYGGSNVKNDSNQPVFNLQNKIRI
jgi:hypothetical protein